jgi:hypothetical protein
MPSYSHGLYAKRVRPDLSKLSSLVPVVHTRQAAVVKGGSRLQEAPRSAKISQGPATIVLPVANGHHRFAARGSVKKSPTKGARSSLASRRGLGVHRISLPCKVPMRSLVYLRAKPCSYVAAEKTIKVVA